MPTAVAWEPRPSVVRTREYLRAHHARVSGGAIFFPQKRVKKNAARLTLPFLRLGPILCCPWTVRWPWSRPPTATSPWRPNYKRRDRWTDKTTKRTRMFCGKRGRDRLMA